MTRIEFFFDCSSPWTYLAFNAVQPIAERHGVTIDWRPILVGGVFNEVNKDLYEARESMFANERRMGYFMKDLADWANFENLKIGWPDFHPVNSVKPMRACLYALDQRKIVPWARCVFEAYWGEQLDISSTSVLEKLAANVGLDAKALVEATTEPSYKDRLRANTDELIERGGFGSPTLFVDGKDMYFGNDRLPLVERLLASRNT